MRYLTLLLKQNPEDNVDYSIEKTEPHIYDNTLYDKYMMMTYLYNTDSELQKNYREIVRLSHPFEFINVEVGCSFLPNNKKMKMTNAFMKMWEVLKWLTNQDKHGIKPWLTFQNNKLEMFDVAGAPGMFIIGTDNFLKKYYPDVKLDWMTCSLEGGTALTDQFKLYETNPQRYIPCDVSNENDIINCIQKANKKFQLITGDIGIYHEDSYEKLQEELQLDIEYGQMILALNLCAEGGIMFLKMYSMVTKETLYLLDTLTVYFDQVYITKPYTTRIFNDESYIICINRNNKDCSKLPLTRPNIKDYTSENYSLVSSFEYSRLDIKFRMVSLIKRIVSQCPGIKLSTLKKNTTYKIYYDEFTDIFNELNWLRTDTMEQPIIPETKYKRKNNLFRE